MTTEVSTSLPRIAGGALKVMRVRQWAKNVLILAPLVFSMSFLEPARVVEAALAVLAFSLLASSGYVLNDLLDRKADARHPKKRHRPIASGALPPSIALGQIVALVGLGLGLAWWVSPTFFAIGLAYLILTNAYSFFLKHVVIIDVMILATFYLPRVVAGAVAIEVQVSEWLFLCTGFLALFLGFHKRRAELIQHGEQGTRRILDLYSLPMLDQFQAITTGSVVLCYALYTALGSQTPWMTLTIPFVLYGIFRYIWLVDQRGEGGAPDETLLRDPPILAAGVLFGLTAIGVLLADQAGLLPAAFDTPMSGRMLPGAAEGADLP